MIRGDGACLERRQAEVVMAANEAGQHDVLGGAERLVRVTLL